MFNMFSNKLIQCPRCLGKGSVDYSDIMRMRMELRWSTGECAYCNGSGVIRRKYAEKVSVDNGYINLNIDQGERRRLFRGDAAR